MQQIKDYEILYDQKLPCRPDIYKVKTSTDQSICVKITDIVVEIASILAIQNLKSKLCFEFQRNNQILLTANIFFLFSADTKSKRKTNLKIQENEINIAKLLQKVTTPNIIKYHDIYRNEAVNKCYYFMEFCPLTLSQYIQQQDFQIYDYLDFIQQICRGYLKLIELNIIHRDIKPDNIVVAFDKNKKPIYKVFFLLQRLLISGKVISSQQKQIDFSLYSKEPKSIEPQRQIRMITITDVTYFQQTYLLFKLGVSVMQMMFGTVDPLTKKEWRNLKYELDTTSVKAFIIKTLDERKPRQHVLQNYTQSKYQDILNIVDCMVTDKKWRIDWYYLHTRVGQIQEVKYSQKKIFILKQNQSEYQKHEQQNFKTIVPQFQQGQLFQQKQQYFKQQVPQQFQGQQQMALNQIKKQIGLKEEGFQQNEIFRSYIKNTNIEQGQKKQYLDQQTQVEQMNQKGVCSLQICLTFLDLNLKANDLKKQYFDQQTQVEQMNQKAVCSLQICLAFLDTNMKANHLKKQYLHQQTQVEQMNQKSICQFQICMNVIEINMNARLMKVNQIKIGKQDFIKTEHFEEIVAKQKQGTNFSQNNIQTATKQKQNSPKSARQKSQSIVEPTRQSEKKNNRPSCLPAPESQKKLVVLLKSMGVQSLESVGRKQKLQNIQTEIQTALNSSRFLSIYQDLTSRTSLQKTPISREKIIKQKK